MTAHCHSQKQYSIITASSHLTPRDGGSRGRAEENFSLPSSVSSWSSECHPGTCQPRGDHWLGSFPKQRHQLLWLKLMQSCQPSIAHPHQQPPDKPSLISANISKTPVNKRNNRTGRCLTHKKKPSSLTKPTRSPGPVLPPYQMHSYTAFHHHSCLDGSPQYLPAHYSKDSQGQLGFIRQPFHLLCSSGYIPS